MRAKVYDGTRPDLGADGDRSPLIASDRVEGTPVRRGGGERIGTIERLMIEKRSGRVACAVMSFGGVLGLGAEHRILPWHVLTYSPELDAYAVSLTDEELGRAPLRGTGQDDPSSDPEWEAHVRGYFNREAFTDEAVPKASVEAKG